MKYPFSKKVKLTCEICGKRYEDIDRKKGNIPVLFHCCSLKCERKSWQRINNKGKRIW
jgi:hypothetical protein